jgi:hypothetical protein
LKVLLELQVHQLEQQGLQLQQVLRLSEDSLLALACPLGVLDA